MTKEQLTAAKEVLYQYEMIRIKRIDALPPIEFRLSEEYEAKKEELREKIKNNTLKPKALTRSQKMGVMIAAVLIIAAIITACAFKNEIKGFLVDLFDSFAAVDYVEDSLTEYEECSLTYLPENYMEISKITTSTGMQIIYSNDNNEICFIFFPASYLKKIIDTELTEFDTFNLEGKEIYYKEKNNIQSFYWGVEDATLYISCSTEIERSDIERMILSVECLE